MMGGLDSETLWVYLEITDATGTKSYRGLVRREDYDAVLEGRYSKPFISVENTFWTKDDNFVLAGRGVNRKFRFTGTFHLLARWITTMAPLTDCTDLFLSIAGDADAVSAWERHGSMVSEVPSEPEPDTGASQPRSRRKKNT